MAVFSTVQAERELRAQVTQTDQRLLLLRELGLAALDAETGQRGYFITLDRRYLDPYLSGRERFPEIVSALRPLIPGEPASERQRLLAQVAELGQAKFSELGRSVALIEEGRIIDAQQAILSDEGQDLMDRFRLALAEFAASERAALATGSAEMARQENTLLKSLALLLAVVLATLALTLWLVFRTARAEAAAANAEELAEARDRADLLARELNHRVKNLFTVVLGIIRMSGRGDVSAKEAIQQVTDRVHALATAHEVTQGAGGQATGDLRELVTKTIAPYRSADQRCTIDGPPVTLDVAQAMPLGLVLHELATNAVKYGAWSQLSGQIDVCWTWDSKRLLIDWRESGANPTPLVPESGGFGSELMERAARQLGGTIERSHNAEGVEVRIELPLAPAGASG